MNPHLVSIPPEVADLFSREELAAMAARFVVRLRILGKLRTGPQLQPPRKWENPDQRKMGAFTNG